MLKQYLSELDLVIHSPFAIGLVGTVVDYVHTTPLPAGTAHYTLYLGLALAALDGARAKWQTVKSDSKPASANS